MPLQRSPTKAMQNETINNSNLCTTESRSNPDLNITTRNSKRRRLSGEEMEDQFKMFKEEIKEMISGLTTNQNARLDALEKHIKEVKSQNTSIQKSNQDIESSVQFMSDQLKALETKIDNLEREKKNVDIKLSALESRIEIAEQNMLKYNIEVRNIPKKKGETREDLQVIFNKICKTLQIDLLQSDVRDIHRLPSKYESKTSAISIELQNMSSKAKLLASAKSYNLKHTGNPLNSAHLGFEGAKYNIFVCEQLTGKAKRLLFLAKDVARTEGYNFCWTSNGTIFLRKNAGDKYIVVKSEDQLNLLKSK